MAARRYRITLWLDSAGNTEQIATATYVDDLKVAETTTSSNPFDTVDELVRAELDRLGVQLALW